MMKSFNHIDTLLFDLNGTIYVKGEPIASINNTLQRLREANYKMSFITNTDGRPPESVHQSLMEMKIDISLEELFTPVIAAKKFMEARPDQTCYCLVSKSVQETMKNFNLNDKNPDYVIIGDFSDRMSYDEINKVFRFIKNGANILALSKTTYYFSQEGINLNTGAFVRMFEEVCEKEAILLGKPSADFFNLALNRTNSCPENTLIVGDDITTDILGAHLIKAGSVLVQTGHYREEKLTMSKFKPDHIIANSTLLLDLLLNH